MTANQQLKDYIAQQTKVGVSKDAIKSALIGAGWGESDVNQAIAESEPVSPAAVSSAPAQTVKPAETFQVSKPSEPAEKSSPVSFVTSDIFRPKGEPVFQSTGAGSQPGVMGMKPEAASLKMKVSSGGKGGLVLTISLSVLSAGLLGGNIYFFLQNSGLNSKLSTLSSGSSSFQTQVASLSADKKTLTDQVDSLNKTLADLNSQLAVFAVSSGSSTAAVPFDVSGTLGGGGKSLYSLTTSKNIVLTVKNSKDADVEATLKTLLGSNVRLGGTHQDGSSQLTVTTVNGQAIQPAVKAASTTATSTTTGTASSTTP